MFWKVLLAIVYIALAVGLIVLVLMQESNEGGLSEVITGSTETFFGKNRSMSPEAKKKRWTAYAAFAFIILSLIFSFVIIRG